MVTEYENRTTSQWDDAQQVVLFSVISGSCKKQWIKQWTINESSLSSEG